MNLDQARKLPTNIIANENINIRSALYHEYENESLYMKDINWSIAKILPAIYPSLHRYKIIEQDASSIDKLKQNLTKQLDILNNGGCPTRKNTSEYILIAADEWSSTTEPGLSTNSLCTPNHGGALCLGFLVIYKNFLFQIRL